MIIDESSAPEGADDPEDVDDPDLSVRDENVRGRSNLHTYIFFWRILHWTKIKNFNLENDLPECCK